jgi:hypothetical protein
MLTLPAHPILNPRLKEKPMQYKTITLELLQSLPQLFDRLRIADQLLAALEACSMNLRTRHLMLTSELSQSRPQTSEQQIKQESFEIALQELQNQLLSVSLPDQTLSSEQLLETLRLTSAHE